MTKFARIIPRTQTYTKFIMEKFYDKYREIYEYFDDWILVKTNRNNHKITKFIIKKQAKNHMETINWK